MNEPILPSRRRLIITTLIALVVAGVVVVTVVLPAEYGVDPTRVGQMLGLTAMGKAKGTTSTATAGVAPADAAGDAAVMHDHRNKFFTGRVEIELVAYEELEYKAALAKGEPLLYEWTAQGSPLYFEFHGEPTEGKWPEGFYQSYQIGESSEGEAGSFVAPFTGVHGWYWRNPSDKPVTITLNAVGYYTSLGRVGGSSAPVE